MQCVWPNETTAQRGMWSDLIFKLGLSTLAPPVNSFRRKGELHSMYEVMGLANMMGLGDRAPRLQTCLSGRQAGYNQEFSQIVREKGLKEALKFRDSQFDPDIARV